jgi:phosphohistidine phosphatase
MELILWRHADAEDPGPAGDAARELTKKGRKQAERMAEWLRPRLQGEWKILCSPAVRAVQTLAPLEMDHEICRDVSTASGPEDVLRAAGWPHGDRVMVVGHQPTLGEVSAHLVGSGNGEMSFRKGAVWWFATRERDGEEEVVLKVVMNPEMLEG